MFSEDAYMAVEEVEIEFLCCKYGGFWDFSKWPDKTIMEVKYIFFGPVLQKVYVLWLKCSSLLVFKIVENEDHILITLSSMCFSRNVFKNY